VRRSRGDGQGERQVGMCGSARALLVRGALTAAGLGGAVPAAGAAVPANDSCTPIATDIHWGTVNGQASVTFVGQLDMRRSGLTLRRCRRTLQMVYIVPRGLRPGGPDPGLGGGMVNVYPGDRRGGRPGLALAAPNRTLLASPGVPG
jgi:hypothetical protein